MKNLMRKTFFSMVVILLCLGVATISHAQAMFNLPGFSANTQPPNDDGSTGPISVSSALGMSSLDYFGNNYSQFYINTNGNLTFTGPLSTYTPSSLSSIGEPIIAPYWADVDTAVNGSAPVTYGSVPGSPDFNGQQAFGVEWNGVAYYASADKLNKFELVLVNRSDVAPGDFDIIYNYDQVQWETGSASGGVDGLGGVSASVGYTNGTNAQTYVLPGSMIPGSFLDSNLSTGLIHNSLNSNVLGRYIFQVRSGNVINTNVPEPGVLTMLMGMGVPFSFMLRRRRRLA